MYPINGCVKNGVRGRHAQGKTVSHHRGVWRISLRHYDFGAIPLRYKRYCGAYTDGAEHRRGKQHRGANVTVKGWRSHCAEHGSRMRRAGTEIGIGGRFIIGTGKDASLRLAPPQDTTGAFSPVTAILCGDTAGVTRKAKNGERRKGEVGRTENGGVESAESGGRTSRE